MTSQSLMIYSRFIFYSILGLNASQGRVLALGGGYNLDDIKAAWSDVLESLL